MKYRRYIGFCLIAALGCGADRDRMASQEQNVEDRKSTEGMLFRLAFEAKELSDGEQLLLTSKASLNKLAGNSKVKVLGLKNLGKVQVSATLLQRLEVIAVDGTELMLPNDLQRTEPLIILAKAKVKVPENQQELAKNYLAMSWQDPCDRNRWQAT